MSVYVTAIVDAFRLIFGGSSDVFPIIGLSLSVSGTAVLLAMLIGIPVGYALGVSRFAGRAILLIMVNTAMGFPPVVVGLFVYMALSRTGPLGALELLFTPQSMVIAQVILAAPLVAGVTTASIASVPRDLRLQVRALGASRLQEALAVLKEARRGVMASVVAGFGGIISEVGAVMIVGGNIDGVTRVMTTAIALETSKGDLPLAMGLGIVLLAIVLALNVAASSIKDAAQRRHG